jgi:CBS domain containing-hemolysin-like protein
MSVSEVNDLLEINLNTKVSYTIGGLVMHQLGHIPDYGESMVEQGYKFSVDKRTDKAIVKLKIEPV